MAIREYNVVWGGCQVVVIYEYKHLKLLMSYVTPCIIGYEVNWLSKWDKLMVEILKLNRNVRFDELARALTRIGYTQSQPKGGSSHYIFRKEGKKLISLPKSSYMNKAYIELVRDVIKEYESEV